MPGQPKPNNAEAFGGQVFAYRSGALGASRVAVRQKDAHGALPELELLSSLEDLEFFLQLIRLPIV